MPYATVADVEIDHGAIPEATREKVARLLERAEARIEQVCDLPARLATGRTNVTLVKQVECEMVCQVLLNPKAWASETETMGPFNRTRQLNTSVASGLLRLTAEQRELLGEPTGGAFTIDARPAKMRGR